MKTLKLACCRYTTKNTLATIGRVCKDLEGTFTDTCVCKSVVHICSTFTTWVSCTFTFAHTHAHTHTYTHAHTYTHTHTHSRIYTELDLQSCLQLKEDALLHIGELRCLKRLNLYTMEICENLLDTIGRCWQRDMRGEGDEGRGRWGQREMRAERD